MHFHRNPLTCSCELGGKACMRIGGKSFNDFKFGTFIGCRQSDGAACMAAKGLNIYIYKKKKKRKGKKELSLVYQAGLNCPRFLSCY